MKTSALAFSFLLCTTACPANDVLGKIVSPFIGSWPDNTICIADCRHIIGILKQADQPVIYLAEFIPSSDPRRMLWKITDQLPYTNGGNNFEVTYGNCEIDGLIDPSLVAVIHYTNEEWSSNIRTAYRANPETNRFEMITPQGLRCENNHLNDTF
ncbi:MAG: hypothetical protein E6Q83_06145 [Thiothrix sp.]|nr:MAG: hypothetical protein E6Q83_06145 [Thiothrix sp.]